MFGFYTRNRMYCSASVAFLCTFGFAIGIGYESPWYHTLAFFGGTFLIMLGATLAIDQSQGRMDGP